MIDLHAPDTPAPWGMGWTRRIGGPEYTANCSPSEAYARLLFLGLTAVGAPVTLFGAFGAWTMGGPDEVPALLVMLVFTNVVAGVVPVATGGRYFHACVMALIAVQQLVVFAQVPLLGGLPHGAPALFWGLVGPVVVVLLIGPRAGFVWWVVYAALAALAVFFPDFPLHRREPIPDHEMILQLGWSAAMACMGAVVFVSWFSELRTIVEGELMKARSQADQLLEDVLPAEVAARLKAGETEIADQFYEVTVLFADVVGFTPMSARLPPAESVRLLNEVFSAFDAICVRHGAEKIRTIGDGYMAVAGAPVRSDDHALVMARVALEMRQWLTEREEELQLRIGLNSGPAVGGIVGTTRFHYDLWGDAVNVAARMESHGEAGRIQIGPRTHTLIEHRFRCAARGPIEVKGRGTMETWWLEEERTAG